MWKKKFQKNLYCKGFFLCPQEEEFVKFGYKSERKVKIKKKNPAIFWLLEPNV
jgi:hypothetical protein